MRCNLLRIENASWHHTVRQSCESCGQRHREVFFPSKESSRMAPATVRTKRWIAGKHCVRLASFMGHLGAHAVERRGTGRVFPAKRRPLSSLGVVVVLRSRGATKRVSAGEF